MSSSPAETVMIGVDRAAAELRTSLITRIPSTLGRQRSKMMRSSDAQRVRDGFLAVRSGDDTVAGQRQHVCVDAAGVLVVVDDQDARESGHVKVVRRLLTQPSANSLRR
jgi:hypothetical protein